MDFRLIEWLKVEHARDPLRLVRAPHLIISHTQRLQLVRAHPDKIKSAADVSTLLDRRSDWAQEWSSKIFEVICTFDRDLAAQAEKNGARKRKRD